MIAMKSASVIVAGINSVIICALSYSFSCCEGLAFSSSSSAKIESKSVSSSATAATTTKTARSSTYSQVSDFLNVSTSVFSPTDWLRPGQRTRKCTVCPDDDDEEENDDIEANIIMKLLSADKTATEHELPFGLHNFMVGGSPGRFNDNSNNVDRREAIFATLGTLWAATTTMSFPESANALYGTDAKIELPNMMQGMSDRTNKQCLVETLGNRECLVYMDENNKLYQGADSQKLLQKVDASSIALTKIPKLVEEKKWSGVKSIITGPMGELLTTMNQLAPLSTQQPDLSINLAKQVKLQIFAISAAADKKDGVGILKSTEGATNALVTFVQSL